jgi:hypothetical protein
LTSGWRWIERRVPRDDEHLRLAIDSEPVALVGRPSDQVFRVQFLTGDETTREEVVRELDFYLLDAGGPAPWEYAVYHTTTAANAYSRVRWSHMNPGNRQARILAESPVSDVRRLRA